MIADWGGRGPRKPGGRLPNGSPAVTLKRVVPQIGARSVPLEPRLLVGGEPEYVVHNGARGQIGMRAADTGILTAGADPRRDGQAVGF